MASSFRLYHDDTVKWVHDGSRYCLHVQQDEFSESPREWDNLCLMACFHKRYSLGDDIKEKDPTEFWRSLVRSNVSCKEATEAALSGKLDGIRIVKAEDGDPDSYDVYETCYLAGFQTSREAKEYLEYSNIPESELYDYLIDDLTIGHCMKLMEPYAEWLPLWLYDHSGITMSCGSRGYPYNDPWDSGQVGWIIAFKDRVIDETREIITDDNGDPVREEHVHSDGSVTYSVKSRPVTDDTWRDVAREHMRNEVETYDQYLTGDTYCYGLYVENDGEWEDIDRCCGFYGDDIVASGMADNVGYGLMNAIRTDAYETGTAELHTRSYYTF